MKILKKTNEETLKKTISLCRERGIVIPTFEQLKNPDRIPENIKERLKNTGLWDVNPVNLFRITWKNEPKEKGGLFNNGNYIEFPPEITGVNPRIFGLAGKYFPTGAHKVGAGFGCLVPRLVSGEFDPAVHKAVWPSTGNFCRGGAFDCALLGCTAVAILPEEMSRERFEWLKSIGAEIIATPGSESNVKEIYDKCWEIKKTRPDCVIFNQFEEFGNSIWHYEVTGSVIEEIFNRTKKERNRLSAFVSATGSAGTIAAGDYLKKKFPDVKIIAAEALQCPTLLRCGFGSHRIEGIGDKHIPWVHNVRNTDMVAAVDDEQVMSLLRLFNEDRGKKYLSGLGVKDDIIEKLNLLGISGICNLITAIKTAKYYEFDSSDSIFTPLTDSTDLYRSRIVEQRAIHGNYKDFDAVSHFARYLAGTSIDNMRELNYQDRHALHNFKYFTWVEQQGKDPSELRMLWNPDFWEEIYGEVKEWNEAIRDFNSRTGLLK
jgi:cysteine synthase